MQQRDGTCPHMNEPSPTRKSSHRMQVFSDLAFSDCLGLLQEVAHRIMSWAPTLNCPWEKSSSRLQKEPEEIRSSELNIGFIDNLPNVLFSFFFKDYWSCLIVQCAERHSHISLHFQRCRYLKKESWYITHLEKETLIPWEVCCTWRFKCVY